MTIRNNLIDSDALVVVAHVHQISVEETLRNKPPRIDHYK